jgi:PIN domain nuclease of toxin-antitoxin system
VSRLVFDSYAILALVRGEAAGGRVQRLLSDRRHQRWMSVINAGEVYCRTIREFDLTIARRVIDWLRSQDIRLSDVREGEALEAAAIKARYRMSYADSFAAELARRMSATIVTGDPEFAPLERDGLVRVEWLTRG